MLTTVPMEPRKIIAVAGFAAIAFAIAYEVQLNFNQSSVWHADGTPPAWFIASWAAGITAAVVLVFWWLFLRARGTWKSSLEGTPNSSRSKLAIANTAWLSCLALGGLVWWNTKPYSSSITSKTVWRLFGVKMDQPLEGSS